VSLKLYQPVFSFAASTLTANENTRISKAWQGPHLTVERALPLRQGLGGQGSALIASAASIYLINGLCFKNELRQKTKKRA